MLPFLEKVPIYQLVENCYVHGLMNGEGLGLAKAEDIILICNEVSRNFQCAWHLLMAC